MNDRIETATARPRDPEWQARLQRLLDESPEYQAFILPDGSSTPGYDRSYLLPRLFGSDFHGKTFFDIGSYLGYFCVEALQRGAAYATGIETDPRNLRQAREFGELFEVRPEYICANFEEWDDHGRQFDTVACLNVLHHMFDPLGALQKMMRMTRDRLVLEVAVPTWRDVMRDRINPLRVYGIGSPAMFLGIPKKRGDAAGRTYLFTPGALKIVLNVHTNAFEPVTISRSPFKGRVLVEARKRHIGHLAIVTGPTGVGKSTLIDRLMADAPLRAQYGLDGSDWQLLQASEADRMPTGRNECVLLHYDFLRPSRTGIRSYDRDPVLHLMGVADRITVLTLMAPGERLRAHIQSGEMARSDRTNRQRKRDRDLLKKYESGVFLNDWYDSWVKYCQRHQDRLERHDLIVNDGSFRPFPIETWPAHFAEAFRHSRRADPRAL